MSALTPRYSAEAEQAVLGGLLLDNETWDSLVADQLVDTDFFHGDHQVIFRAIRQLAIENKPFDILSVSETIKASADANRVDLAYLAEIAQNTPSTANMTYYCGIVKECAQLRTLMQIGFDCSRQAAEMSADSTTVQEHIEKRLYALTQHKQGQGFVDIKQGIISVINTIEEHTQNGNPVTGVTTGLTDLDRMTAGLQGGDLVVLAARPSMGKTSLAIGLAEAALWADPEETVQFYSLEMPGKAILFRLLAKISGLSVKDMMQGQLPEDGWAALSNAVGRLNEKSKQFILDETASLTPTALRAKARRSARLHGKPSLIVVDYLQLMRVEGKRENRHLEIAEISASLKALAKEMDCPVVALSQLNRSLENRTNKRPVLADLRESGAIEQDADLIMFIYRDEVYNPDTSERGIAEIIIGKFRNGPTGIVRTAFQAEQARFENLAKEQPYYSFGPKAS